MNTGYNSHRDEVFMVETVSNYKLLLSSLQHVSAFWCSLLTTGPPKNAAKVAFEKVANHIFYSN